LAGGGSSSACALPVEICADRQLRFTDRLLDKADTAKVLARSHEPLVRPEPSDREGYVPNVVYTCGGMRHGERIILPYAVSDTYCSVGTMKIAALIDNLRGES
jgi:predicted GH43/DUF377 family glycosyl hydrolase